MVKKDIAERTFNFSIKIIKLCKYLREQSGTGYDISKQLIRSGTAIGANKMNAECRIAECRIE
jgi:four helix bundle protein